MHCKLHTVFYAGHQYCSLTHWPRNKSRHCAIIKHRLRRVILSRKSAVMFCDGTGGILHVGLSRVPS